MSPEPTYFLEQSDHDYEKYILPHAGGEQAVCQKLICPQFDGPTWRRFNNDEVCNVLSASRCGVILSAEEGACFAAVEYLLCGLPVVTTPSIGGRDAMFDSDYVIYAEPDPESVAEAVKKAANLTISPEEIRERTIAKIRKGREQYCRILDNIAREEGVDRNFLADWDSFYVNKMINGMSEDDTIRYLNASGVETHYSLLHRLHNMHRDFKLWLEHRAKR